MKKKSPVQRQKDDVRVLIEEAKIRNGFGDGELSRYLGIADRTLRERRADPGGITLDKLIIIMELTGKEMKFVERA